MGKTGEHTSMAADESHKHNEVITEARNEGRVVLRDDFVKDDSVLTQYLQSKVHQQHK